MRAHNRFTAILGLAVVALLMVFATAFATGPPGQIDANSTISLMCVNMTDCDVGVPANQNLVGEATYSCTAMNVDLSGGSGAGAILMNQAAIVSGVDNYGLNNPMNYAVKNTEFAILLEGTAGFAGGTSPGVNDALTSTSSLANNGFANNHVTWAAGALQRI